MNVCIPSFYFLDLIYIIYILHVYTICLCENVTDKMSESHFFCFLLLIVLLLIQMIDPLF